MIDMKIDILLWYFSKKDIKIKMFCGCNCDAIIWFIITSGGAVIVSLQHQLQRLEVCLL